MNNLVRFEQVNKSFENLKGIEEKEQHLKIRKKFFFSFSFSKLTHGNGNLSQDLFWDWTSFEINGIKGANIQVFHADMDLVIAQES
jgi:hypothetical protein